MRWQSVALALLATASLDGACAFTASLVSSGGRGVRHSSSPIMMAQDTKVRRGLGPKRGVVAPTRPPGARNSTPRRLLVPDNGEVGSKKHLGIKELLTEYGLIALVFHFTVWGCSLAAVYAALSTGLDADHLPDFLGFLASEDGALGDAAGFAGRATATLGIVEAVGPARLALTVACTPRVSTYARQYAGVRRAEETAARAWDAVAGVVRGGS